MTIRILLADDHKIIRDGLKTLIENQPDMEVVAEADNGREAVELTGKLTPNVVIMDITMPDLNGIEATRRIVDAYPGVRVIALSMHSDKRFISEILGAGASGYLLKDCAFEELARAIQTVMDNQTYLYPGITDTVIKDYVHNLPSVDDSAASLLTAREREVLQAIAEGKNTKQIAKTLHVSVKTVETHRKKIMDKLDIHSVAELTKYAVREGLTSLED